MNGRMVFFLVVSLLVIAVAMYAWYGMGAVFKTDPARRIARIFWWAGMATTIGGFIVMTFYFSGGLTKSTFLTSTLMGLTFCFFAFNLILSVFLLGEDVFRLGRLGYDALTGGEEGHVQMVSRRKFIGQLGMIVAAIPFSGLLYGMFKGKYDFTVHRHTMAYPDLPAEFDGLKIAQISDIHAGSFTDRDGVKKGLDLLMAQEPDVILFTGDLVNNLADEVTEVEDLFKAIHAPLGKFSVLGNHDYGEYLRWESAEAKAENQRRVRDAHGRMGFRLLLNESLPLEMGNARIRLAGVENWGAPPFPQYGDLNKALEGEQAGEFTILMSHDPSHWDGEIRAHAQQVHLTLSGHTHGAQFGVEIPGFRWSPAQGRYKQWAGPYHDEKGQTLYVNRGFGFIGFPGRFGIWPEITLIELRRA